MSPRRRSSVPALAWGATAFLLLAALGAAGDILHHGLGQVDAAVLIAGAAYVLGRRSGRSARRAKPSQRELPSAQLAQLRGDVADLEAAAGRPLTAITASYRQIQRHYRTGAGR